MEKVPEWVSKHRRYPILVDGFYNQEVDGVVNPWGKLKFLSLSMWKASKVTQKRGILKFLSIQDQFCVANAFYKEIVSGTPRVDRLHSYCKAVPGLRDFYFFDFDRSSFVFGKGRFNPFYNSLINSEYSDDFV